MGIAEVGLGIVLCIQSYWDIRDKEIPIIVNMIGGVIGLILAVWNERIWVDILWALVPGGVCLLLGRMSREAIGYGDGILVCVMGLFLSWEKLVSICLIALMLAAIVGLLLLTMFHKKGNYEMPFVPFIAVAFVAHCVL